MSFLRNAAFIISILSCCFIGCGKDDPPAAPIKEDTLSKGWSKLLAVPGSLEMFFVDNSTGFINGKP